MLPSPPLPRTRPCDFHRSPLTHFTTLDLGGSMRKRLILVEYQNYKEVFSVKVWICVQFYHDMPSDLSVAECS